MLQGIEKKSIEGFVEKMKQDYCIREFLSHFTCGEGK